MANKESVHAIIDVHEPPEITGEIDGHPDVESYEIQELPAADIEIEGIGFERKTPSDFASSLTEGRLDEQTQKLNQRYDIAYVLIEGSMAETENIFKSAISGESLRGAEASLTAREDSGVQAALHCSNSSLLVDMAVRLARKHIEDSDSEYIPTPDIGIDEPTGKMMYACIPGIGPSTASTLYEEYPSITDFVENADYDSLQELEGIGDQTALDILEAIA